jgi:hypothetical protein
LKWSRRTTQKIAKELHRIGIEVSPSTVSHLLKDMGFSLKANRKSISHSTSPHRNEQFEYIASMREIFAHEGSPIISVDTKKKEQVGPFKNPGSCWVQESQAVNDHDFRSLAEGIAIPFWSKNSNRLKYHSLSDARRRLESPIYCRNTKLWRKDYGLDADAGVHHRDGRPRTAPA